MACRGMVQRLPRHKHGTLEPWSKPAGEKLNVKAVATMSADAASAAMLFTGFEAC